MAKSSDIHDRICEIRDVLCNGDNSFFAEKIDRKRQYASGLCTGKNSAGKKILDHILDVFPEVSKVWLLTGEGEMLKTDSSRQRSSVAGDNRGIIVQHGDNSTYNNNSELASVVLAQQETINKQQVTITALTETNRQQTEQIGKLIEMLSK